MRRLFALATVLSIIAAVACGGDQDATSGGPSVGEIGRSADGLASVSGRAGLSFSFTELRDAPGPPAGWQFMGPVYDITALDHDGREVTGLDTDYTLSFTVGDLFPATVLVFEEGQWVIVPSEFDSHGVLMADINHLTPYAAARPTSSTQLNGSSSGAAPSPPASNGGLPTAAARTPRSDGATRPPSIPVAIPTLPADVSIPSFTVAATVGVGEVTTEQAKAALEAAIKAIKQKAAIVTGAAGYTGTVSVAIPPALQETLGSALAGGGTGYYGLYNGVNEAAYVEAAGGSASGALTLLVEPKTSMPADVEAARADLQTLFPGIPSGLTEVTATTDAFVFYMTSGAAAYAFGYVT